MTRNYSFSVDEYYHVYNRGTEKRKIFINKNDHERFKFLLYICNNSKPIVIRDYIGLTSVEKFNLERGDTMVDIGAYCLMPNHFHLLLKEKIDNGVSLFMQKLTTAYTMYFNTVYERSGSLLQGTFKAKHANKDQYLEYLYTYIHLNPIKLIEPEWKEKGIKSKEKAKKFLAKYPYSSYLDFIGIDRVESRILNRSVFPGYFQGKSSFLAFLKSWMESDDEFT